MSRSTDSAGRGSSRGLEEDSFVEGPGHLMVVVVRQPEEVAVKTARSKVEGQCFLGVVGRLGDL